MSNLPLQDAVLTASRDGVTLYSLPSRSSAKWGKADGKRGEYRPYKSGEEIGPYTGVFQENNEGTWVKVRAYAGNWKPVNRWVGLIPVYGAIVVTNSVINPNTEPYDYWMNVADGDYDIQGTPESQAAQAKKDAAAAKAKQQQALIDVVGGGNNANLTANGGTTTNNNSIYWIVGGVLVFIAGLVIWKVASKPKAVAAVPTAYVPTAPAIPKPTKLR